MATEFDRKIQGGTIGIHPLADAYPMMCDQTSDEAVAAWDALKRDIAENGIKDPIVIHCGLVIDGRNRMKAAVETGKFVNWTMSKRIDHGGPREFGQIMTYVNRKNNCRRIMTKGELAITAAKIADLAAADAKKRQSVMNGRTQLPANLPEAKGDARDIAAKQTGVSGRTVSDAQTALKADKRLEPLIASGKVAVSRAAKEVRSGNVDEFIKSIDKPKVKKPAPKLTIAQRLYKQYLSMSDRQREEFDSLVSGHK